MKRFIAIFLIIQLMLLAGCALPFFGKSKNEPSSLAEGQEMMQMPADDSSKTTGGGSMNISGSGIAAGAGGNGGMDNSSAAVSGGAINGNAGTSGNTGDSVIAPGTSASSGMSDASSLTTDNASSISEAQGDALNGSKPEGTGVMAAESGSGSSANYSEPRRPVIVYYQDGDGYLVPMTRWIEPQQGIARATINLIVDSALNREEIAYYGVFPVLPADTEILGIDIRNGIAVVDFSRNLLNYGSVKAERNIIASIVYTLTEFDTIYGVRILINGYPQGIMKYGSDLTGELGREDVAINAEPSVLTSNREKEDVFFLKQANTWYTYPVPVTMVSTGGSGSRPEELVKLLLSTVSKDGLDSEMPGGVKLLGTSTKDGVITLNFSSEFANYGGTAREEGILKQLAYTLRQCKDIKKIKLQVEGREAVLPEGTDISDGLSIPVTVNDVMDR